MVSENQTLLRVISGWNNTYKHVDFNSREVPHRPRKISKTLYDLARQDGGNLYAIFNAARNSEIMQYLAMGEMEFESLYKGTSREKYFAASPILIRFQKYSYIMNWLLTEAWCSQWTEKDDYPLKLSVLFNSQHK